MDFVLDIPKISLRVLSCVLLTVSFCRAAPQYHVLHGFTGGADGGGAFGGPALDRNGKVFGTTSGGGAYGLGTVYVVKPKSHGEWVEKVLHSFNNDEGIEPEAGVTFDAAGNFYGAAQLRGLNNGGSIFQMTPSPAGWTFTVTYQFCAQPGCSDGGGPSGPVTLDGEGNIFGTAFNVFELSPAGPSWMETVLHDFCQKCNDGWQPFSGVTLDAKGNLYGTTLSGGKGGAGVVFKLRHMPDGTWQERILHSFPSFSNDGGEPGFATPVFDPAGSLYGTTVAGGGHRCGETTCGTVYKLTKQPNGHWKETILHSFKKISSGYGPSAGVVFDKDGNLYGTTAGGGSYCDCGVIYQLSPNPDGTWTYTVLHNFAGTDGAGPGGGLILDDHGNLYGTAFTGGPGGAGVVFELTP